MSKVILDFLTDAVYNLTSGAPPLVQLARQSLDVNPPILAHKIRAID